ncbi:MAG: UbiD family decarboxylase, partial [Candidatus Caldarchaeum sp.]
MAYYKDIREFIQALETNNRLIRVGMRVNKDTELMPLVRLQFRGLPEEERKGFLFENVVDSKGKKYRGSCATSLLGSTHNYALGLKCSMDEIRDKWMRALEEPIEPKIVSWGPCKEEVHKGSDLERDGGLLEFPIPLSTPGFDPAPFLTAPCWVTKDPETGIRNVGTYRAMVKSPTKTNIQLFVSQHEGIHWSKKKSAGAETMEAAISISPVPAVLMTSVAKIPYGMDEYAVAGGLAGEPIELVKCETVDLEVPATSEIVIEG